MANDRATMATRIADEVDDDGLTNQIVNAIDTAIGTYERRRFYFNLKTFTFSTVASQEYYDPAIAADIATFAEVDTQYLTSGGIRFPLNVTTFGAIDESQTGSVTGRPTNWAVFGQKFRLYPIPLEVFVVTVAGHCRLAASDTSAWYSDAEELIRQRAKRILAVDVTKDVDAALAAQSLENEALEALLLETQRRRGRPLLRVDMALTGCPPFNIMTG